ncbi:MULTISPECIES: hypothetical protein [unclassified Paenibacillus]|uniref:hypothetical protein n=1 Tax=unclassified Paenibacillus TaxID=185978 RepID=UPI0010D5E2D1|nr:MULTISPECIES: hypothetical protein [unclassified Paenibacillus]NIK71710.1 hypothetical protein [Paenibacillus sp. BK720]TCM96358.1 uracil DNA glycosylase superfamily protein [Paenibacillus sp. BK033]
MLINSNLEKYEAFIRELPLKSRYSPNDLLVPELCMMREGPIEMYYAPHNDYGNPLARIMIVGITPGWNQMEIAIRTAKLAMLKHKSAQEICKEAKMAARFAGSMRSNLIQMLNELNLHSYYGLADCKALFEDESTLLHTTSLLRYPVFTNKKNYSGHSPELSKNVLLYTYAYQLMMSELEALNHTPLIIPLGKSVELVFKRLLSEKKINEKQVVWGFPHPSGANGNRLRQFQQYRDEMEKGIRNFVLLQQ